MFTHQLYIEMEFVSGNLKGITYKNYPYYRITADYVDSELEAIQKLIDTKRVINAIGSSDYIIKAVEAKEIV